MKIPYERIVQWVAGPLSIVAGYLATQLVTHVGLFGSLGVTHDQIARAIVSVGTFAVGAGVTYAAHHKWLTNLPEWWHSPQANAVIAQVTEGHKVGHPVVPESARTPDPPLEALEGHKVGHRAPPENPPERV